MGTKTGIEWTDATWNPIRGCSPVSPGCKNCYAASVAKRFSFPGGPYEGLVRINAAGERTDDWNGAIRFVEKHLLDPLKWKTPRRIFVNSMSDLFHENLTDEVRDRIFAVMFSAPQHTFQVLTKRPEVMRAYFSENNPRYTARRIADAAFDLNIRQCCFDCDLYFPLDNVWLGVSVENQKAADERIPLLLQTPAAVRFLSCEPLLGPITFKPSWVNPTRQNDNPIGWVICGGESGAGARPISIEWARSLRDQCQAAGVPFFFKQWGEWVPAGLHAAGAPGRFSMLPQMKFGGDSPFATETDSYPRAFSSFGSVVCERIGKKTAGALLDGVEWKQFPAVPA